MFRRRAGWTVFVLTVASVLALGSMGAPPVAAQPLPQSPEFLVNTYTLLSQATPSIAADAMGRFVVVWSQYDDNGMPNDVTARLFDSSGNGLAPDFQVNVFTTGQQRSPSVGRSGTGEFVIVWSSVGQDGDGTAVAGRRYTSSGTALASEFIVNTHTANGQSFPRVAMGTGGNFVVVWQSDLQDGSSWGIFGRRFDSAGTALGTEFQVNAHVASDQQIPNVFLKGDDSFIATWNSNGQDGGGIGAFGRRFDSAGSPVGLDFQIPARTENTQSIPTLAYDPNGGFIATWQSDQQDGSEFGVFGRRFTDSATPVGDEFQVNVVTAESQFQPVVLTQANGSFVVVWYGDEQGDTFYDVYARAFDRFGQPRGGAVTVNTTTENTQRFPRAVATGQRFVVTWQSALQDGQFFGVVGRRFLLPLTLDVDGDGQVLPLTDSLLLLRSTFGFRGSVLINGAVSGTCTRCDAPSIEAYIALI
jgi:hypothetical protein